MLRLLTHVRPLLVAIAAISLLVQCRAEQRMSVAMDDVSIDGWDNPITVTYTNTDQDALCDLGVTLHVNRRFTSQEIELEITTLTPDSLRYSEVVTLPAKAEWPSKQSTTMDIAIPYRHDVRLMHEGEYYIVLRPMHSIEGVEAAGINFQIMR